MSIKLKLTGALGNQMFQFAAGYCAAKKRNTELNLDLSWFNRRNLHNGFELDNVFNIYSQIDFLNRPLSFKKFNLKDFFIKIDRSYETFDEPHFQYTSKITKIPEHCFLRGYWQSEKYFEEFSNEIKSIFSFNKPLNEENNKIAQSIINSRSVSIHIRGGDFLLKRNQKHQVDLKKYYSDAIKTVLKNHTNPKFFIFSDDFDWVSKNNLIESNYVFVRINQEKNSFLDMQLMSLCDVNIIANSSFSWWSAWLNNKMDKSIFAPKNWFSDPSIITDDLIPKSWNKI